MRAEDILAIINFNTQNFLEISQILLLTTIFVYVALVIWVLNDISKRTNNANYKFLAFLCILLFNVVGLVVYLLLRPRKTLAEIAEENYYERKNFLIEENHCSCPKCHYMNELKHKFCVVCGTDLEFKCNNCSEKIDPIWKYCPLCRYKVEESTKDSSLILAIPKFNLGYKFKKLNDSIKYRFDEWLNEESPKSNPSILLPSSSVKHQGMIHSKQNKLKKKKKKR